MIEHLALTAADALRHQIAAEVTAGDETGIGRETQRPFIGTGHAMPFQPGRDLARPHAAAITVGCQTRLQCSVGRIDAQADDMNGVPRPGDGDFDARNEDQPPGWHCARRRPACGSCRRVKII